MGQAEKVELLSSVSRGGGSKEAKAAELALAKGAWREAEGILLQAGLPAKAILLNVSLARWMRSLLPSLQTKDRDRAGRRGAGRWSWPSSTRSTWTPSSDSASATLRTLAARRQRRHSSSTTERWAYFTNCICGHPLVYLCANGNASFGSRETIRFQVEVDWDHIQEKVDAELKK